MILCAAIKYRHDGQEIIVPGWRHGEIFSMMHDLNCNRKEYIEVEEGFITTDNRFLNRSDAFYHALECHQLSASTRELKTERNEIELYSEDLY